MGRAPCCDKANVKRGPWSPEEDATLKNFVQTHGTGGNWIALPHKAGLRRCGKSCRLRWLNYLRPDIKHGGFTEEEDNVICTLYSQMGSRWSLIASQLPGRTDNDVKNYWNTKLRKKILARKSSFNNITDKDLVPPNTNITIPPHQPPPPNLHLRSPRSEPYYLDYSTPVVPNLSDVGYGFSSINGSQNSGVEQAMIFTSNSTSLDMETKSAGPLTGNGPSMSSPYAYDSGNSLMDQFSYNDDFPYEFVNGFCFQERAGFSLADVKPQGLNNQTVRNQY